jgi:D-arabinonate dehydratase
MPLGGGMATIDSCLKELISPNLIDVNMAWTADQAIHTGSRLEPYDVYWLEEPVSAEDVKGYFGVAEKLNIRIVGGENHFIRYDMRPFFENPDIPILQPDVIRADSRSQEDRGAG